MGQETELAAPWQSSYRWALPSWSKDHLLVERPAEFKGTWSQFKRDQSEKRLMGQETELAAPWQSSDRWALPGWSKDQLLVERPIEIKGTWSTMNHLFPVRHVTVVSGRGIAIKGIRWWWLVASASLLDSTYAAFCWGVIRPWHASDSRHLYVGTECQIL